MLKIKDNVDLKELEKFGFYIEEYEDGYKQYTNNDFDIELKDEIYHKENTRKIFALTSARLDTLYDLIQAGLVEKVKEE